MSNPTIDAVSVQPVIKQRRTSKENDLESFKTFLLGEIKEGVSTGKLLLGLRSRGFEGSLRSLQRYLRANKARNITTMQKTKEEWMRLVLQGAKTASQIGYDSGDILTAHDVTTLLECVLTKHLKLRNRALALLAHGNGITQAKIASFLCVTRSTVRPYISDFKKGGIQWVLDLSRKEIKKAEDPNYAALVFATLHSSPITHGFNRTTWRMEDLHAVLLKQGMRIARSNIRKIIKAAGYRFRKAKNVLTSSDPDYSEKLKKITQILENLMPDERFFSVDEFGPFAVKIQGGLALAKPGEFRSVPQYQTSKGSLIVTEALELSKNQVILFYSAKKNTDEMIQMLDLLLTQYRGQRQLYISWDAATWHISKKFFQRVKEINELNYRTEHGTPMVDLAPLPSSAQFLNVIESVFSGMARAIIHNSDYQSVGDCQAAISRYFEERNDQFQKHPKRAGNKIWGKERVIAEFNVSNNCKDPRW